MFGEVYSLYKDEERKRSRVQGIPGIPGIKVAMLQMKTKPFAAQ